MWVLSTPSPKEGAGTFSLERLSPKKSFHQPVPHKFFPLIPVYVSDLAEGFRSHGTDSVCKLCVWCVYWQGIFIPFVNATYVVRVCWLGEHFGVRKNDWDRKDSIPIWRKGGRSVGKRKFTFSVSHSRAGSSSFCGRWLQHPANTVITHVCSIECRLQCWNPYLIVLIWDISWPFLCDTKIARTNKQTGKFLHLNSSGVLTCRIGKGGLFRDGQPCRQTYGTIAWKPVWS